MNHSTPLSNYWDNPHKQMQYLLTLEEPEARIFTEGYIQACLHLLETITDTKNRFLAAAMDEDLAKKDRALRFVALLDTFDLAVSERVATLRSLDTD